MWTEIATGFTAAYADWESAPQSFKRRLPLVYQKLRERAVRVLEESTGVHGTTPTGVVDETLRLVDTGRATWKNRREFLNRANKVMGQVVALGSGQGQGAGFAGGGELEDLPITELLVEWERGSSNARDLLILVVHRELRRMAQLQLDDSVEGHTLQTTILINEVYLRLAKTQTKSLKGTSEFFEYAAQAMRRILVDAARSNRKKEAETFTGQGLDLVKLDEAVDLVKLDEALGKLEELDPRHARVTELRFFLGLTEEETARVLGVSRYTVQRDWRSARAWLFREMNASSSAEQGTDDRFLAESAIKDGLKMLEEADNMVGQKLGGYQVTQEIGRGGMGAVFLAERPADSKKVLRERVAIKVLPRVFGTHGLLSRFKAEQKILARLDHPSIASFYNSGSDDGVPYFVMEYVDGQPIEAWCQSRKSPIAERLGLFCKVADAVAYAHRHRVVHRDLKPSNILVQDSGTPKLLDFGIAEFLDEAATEKKRLRAVTLEYASPEQLRSNTVTTSNDIYSLGVLLYKLLTERLPYRFADRTLDGALRTLTTEPLKVPSQAIGVGLDAKRVAENRSTSVRALRKTLRGTIDNIVTRALETEAEDRFATVEELAQQVRAWVSEVELEG